jgi:hypothetical protein
VRTGWICGRRASGLLVAVHWACTAGVIPHTDHAAMTAAVLVTAEED